MGTNVSPESPQAQTAEEVQYAPPEPEAEVKQHGTPPAPPSTGRAGLMRRIAEGWKNNSPVLATIGAVCGVLGLIKLFTISITGWTFFCLIGIICGVKGLKSGKKALSVAALFLCCFEILFLIVSGVLVAMGIV